MANARIDLKNGSPWPGEPLASRIQAAEDDYLSCISDFGCESGEALAAQWHLRELQRQAHCGG